ncbi:hypothetical protein YC2023_091286 [Brassica napus]
MGFANWASRIIAQFIVMGSGILGRAFFQAYRQAIANASKTGVAQEAMQNAVRKAGKAINAQEARQILGVTEQTSWEEILLKYDKLFENNVKAGSFYLQSKVVRAKECLEPVLLHLQIISLALGHAFVYVARLAFRVTCASWILPIYAILFPSSPTSAPLCNVLLTDFDFDNPSLHSQRYA